MKNNLALLLALSGSMWAGAAYGQAQNTYIKGLNSLLPVAPEASQLMRSIDFPVNLSTGSPSVGIPLYTVTAKDISVPIGLNYVAGGGVKVSDLAGECGLGWSLSCGEISREVRGTPDEGNASAAGLFNNTKPLSYYVNLFANMTGTMPLDFEQAAKGQLDLEPDVYYFHFGSKSGKFVFNSETGGFECLVQKPMKINFSGSAQTSSFMIIDDDGTKYVFSDLVKSSTRSECTSQAANMTLTAPVVTTWKLSKIVNADQTDSVMFSYTFGTYHFYSEGSSTNYLPMYGTGAPGGRPNMNCYNYNEISNALSLNRIYSSTDTVIFEKETTPRQDVVSGAYALSRIRIKSRNGDTKHIYKFNYDYYTRTQFIGTPPESAVNNKSLRLLSIMDYGNSEANANPPKWEFTYSSTNLPGRLSYAIDFWGFANDNNVNTLVPSDILYDAAGNPVTTTGANRSPSPNKMQAGILQSVKFPTGGTTTFTYEPNTTSAPSAFMSANGLTTVINSIVDFKLPDSVFNTTPNAYMRTFTISQPPNPAINNNHPNGGVFANFSVFPNVSGWNPSQELSPDNVQFELSGPTNITVQAGVSQMHLDSGTYTMRIKNLGVLNTTQARQLTRAINFTISYKVPDTTQPQQTTYNCGGVRVKSTVTTDPYAGSSITKQYLYGDPVTDSSYGKFVGASYNAYIDYLVASIGQQSPDLAWTVTYPYLVRTGNCVMPGATTAGSSVFYPKVTEQVLDGNKRYRVEHTFYYNLPDWDNTYPYAPPLFNESTYGKMLTETAFKDLGNNAFSIAGRKSFVYNTNPQTETGPLSHFIPAVKCTPMGYATNTSDIQAAFLLDPAVKPYNILSSRAYLSSDSTITYDTENGTTHSQWRAYLMGRYNQQPVRIQSANSDGLNLTTYNYYAQDNYQPSTEISGALSTPMITANRLSQQLGSRQLANGTQTVSQQFMYGHFSGSRLLTDSIRQAIGTNTLDKEADIISYSPKGNPQTLKLRGGLYQKYILRDDENLVLASCQMLQDGAFAFSSFEYPTEAGASPAGMDNSAVFSGSWSYKLNTGNLVLTGFNSPSGLDVYVWGQGGLSSGLGGPISANGVPLKPTGRTKGTWMLYRGTLPSSTSTVTISNNAPSQQVWIDQLAIIPTGSDFEGNVYDGQQRIVAKVNANMQTLFFEYDNFGRLKLTRDETGSIIEQTDYQYQGPQ